jgi:hypothetical protein
MRSLFTIITLTLSTFVTSSAESAARPTLSFSLTATNQSFTRQLDGDLSLRVERDGLGWEVGVFRGHSTDNLLYPQRTWHGAFPCQLAAWSHRTRTFPGERVIAVRGLKRSVRIRLIDAAVSGESGSERFTGGRVEIHWKHDHSPKNGTI